mmetsp:Transcript_33974/g.84679  ORF Transcript_33974/g.84679 Transcript_33974/m.84679 type:complete len:230 (+) Transcript_33974:4404-5093(+)
MASAVRLPVRHDDVDCHGHSPALPGVQRVLHDRTRASRRHSGPAARLRAADPALRLARQPRRRATGVRAAEIGATVPQQGSGHLAAEHREPVERRHEQPGGDGHRASALRRGHMLPSIPQLGHLRAARASARGGEPGSGFRCQVLSRLRNRSESWGLCVWIDHERRGLRSDLSWPVYASGYTIALRAWVSRSITQTCFEGDRSESRWWLLEIPEAVDSMQKTGARLPSR